MFFFFKQKTAYELRISDWSSDVCSSDLPWLREFLEARGYYDVFLISAKGDVVYTVFKESDFATNLETGEWKDSGLATVYRKARDSASAGAVAFVDFAAYAPSNGAAASLIAAPVMRDGRLLGVLAFPMPIGRPTPIGRASGRVQGVRT